MQQRQAPCVTLWVGDALGPVERACLRSVVRQGHDLTLYCYGEPAGLPKQVEVQDAATVLPQSLLDSRCGGKVAIFADWFRYELLRRGAGTWVDTDLYLLAPIDHRADHLFGWQDTKLINNALLRLPADSPLIGDLLRLFETDETPPWLSRRAWLAARARKLLGRSTGPAALPWGTTGPHALTALATSAGLASRAASPEVFFPVPWSLAAWIADPRRQLEQMITARTVAVHLWNECIKGFKDAPAAEGSFLQRLQREGC